MKCVAVRYHLPASRLWRSSLQLKSSRNTCAERTMASRIATSMSDVLLANSRRVYESDDLLCQYLSLHYGQVEQVYPKPFWYSEVGWLRDCLNFPRKISQLTYRVATERRLPLERALDLGCAVGASSFELATMYKQVVGIDISSRFIQVANEMKATQRVPYLIKVEGDVTQQAVAELASDVDPARVSFLEGDACKLTELGLGMFDAVLMANLICRVPNPRMCLEQVTGLLNPGGLLVMTTPFTWMEQYTEKEQWIGAAAVDGQTDEIPRSASALADLLSPNYDLVTQKQIPVVIREHSRKFQLILPDLFIWQKKGAPAAPVEYDPSTLYGRSLALRKDAGAASGLWLPPSAQKPGPRPSEADVQP